MRLEGEGAEDIGPDGIFRVWRLWDDPEALARMMDDGDDFIFDGSDGPGFPQEVEGIIGVEAALEVEGQVQVQQWNSRDRAQVIAFFLKGQFPGGIGSQAGGSADMVLVVPVNLGLEQGIGVFVVSDFFVSQQSDQTVLEGAEAAFDFTLGWGVRSDAVSHTQGGEGALELGMSIEPIRRGVVAKESQAIGVKAGGRSVSFQHRTKVGEVRPSRIAGGKGAAQDFSRVVIQGENEAGILFGGPPGMR